ncbi:MAG: carbohydrate kinase family protein, partial [Patescibacteria group bacterium]
AQKLKTKASLISAVGTDDWGKKYISIFPVSSLSGKTSHVEITLDKHRSPSFSKWHLGALKKFSLNSTHKKFLSTQTAAHCVAIKPLKSILDKFCQMKLPGVFKSADFDGTTPYSFSIKEILPYLSGLDLIAKSVEDNHSLSYLKKLAQEKNKIILATYGAQGSWVFNSSKTFFQPAIKTQAADTTGAGDAYLATFIISYLQTKNIQKAMLLSTQAATKTITRLGASA